MTKRPVGDLQLSILRVLWRLGRASVAEVHEALRTERDLAPTTVATMLTKMEKRGLVSHETEGRRFIYSSEVSEESLRHSMVSELTARLFRGDATALVSHLLSEHELDEAELSRIRQLVEQAELEGT